MKIKIQDYFKEYWVYKRTARKILEENNIKYNTNVVFDFEWVKDVVAYAFIKELISLFIVNWRIKENVKLENMDDQIKEQVDFIINVD